MKSKRKTPDIRFRGFTDDWEQRKLGEMSNISRGASPRPIQNPKWFSDDSEVGWLRISDVTAQDGRIHYLEQRLSLLGQQKTRVLVTPHLLLSIAATVGKPLINYVKIGVHDGFLIFYDPKFNIDYMFQWFEMFRPKWIKYGQPGSQVNLNSEIVKNQVVNMPSSFEQDKISDLFTNIDNTITLHQRKLQQLKEVKRGMLDVSFPTKNLLVPKIRYARSEEKWRNGKLGNFSIINKGKQRGKSEISESFDSLNKFPVYNGGQSLSGYTDVYNRENKVMMSEGGASAGFVNYYEGKYWSGGHNFTFDQGENDIYYLKAMLEHHQERLYTLKVGSGLPNIQLSTIREFKVSFPKHKEQKEIGSFFKKLDRMIELQEREIELLEETKKGFLQKMFV